MKKKIKHIAKRWSWMWIGIIVFGYTTYIAASRGLVRQTVIWGAVTIAIVLLAELDYRLRKFSKRLQELERILRG